MTKQYLRNIKLSVSGPDVSYDLSGLQVEFQVNNAIVGTPKWGTIRIWNLGPDKATQIIHEFSRVDLSTSYGDEDRQTVLHGEIAQARFGRENAVDSILEIMVQDADRALVWGVISKTITPPWTDDDVLKAVLTEWKDYGVTLGYRPPFDGRKHSDGCTLHGQIFDVMEELAHRQKCNWFIEDGKLNIVPKTGHLPVTTIPELSSESGLLGTPWLTYQGIQGRCLLNPLLKVGGLVRLRNSDVSWLALKQPIMGVTDPGSIVPTLNNPVDTYGTYKVLAVTHEGNSRENQWETRFICCDADNTAFSGGAGLVSVPAGGAL